MYETFINADGYLVVQDTETGSERAFRPSQSVPARHLNVQRKMFDIPDEMMAWINEQESYYFNTMTIFGVLAVDIVNEHYLQVHYHTYTTNT